MAITNITFNLNIAFRFFLVIYADGFVKKGQLDLKLFKQLYWLAWFGFISIELTMFPITPMIKGDFHFATSRGRICIMIGHLDDVEEQEDSLQMYIMKFGLVVQFLYTLSFVKRIRKYVFGQCPGNNFSSIGRYRRNIVNLRWEFWCSVLGSCFPGVDYVVRKISMSQNPTFAFIVNFVLLDSVLYLFFMVFFLSVRREPIPSKEEAPKKCSFYVSKPRYLEPRRSKQIASSLALEERLISVRKCQFPNIPLIRKTVPQPEGNMKYRVTNYISTKTADHGNQQMRNGAWLETCAREKLFKNCATQSVCPVQLKSVCSVQLNGNPDVIESHLKQNNPSCSSKQTCKSNCRFIYII